MFDVVERSCSTVTVIAAVVGSLLLGFVFGLLVFGFIWRRRQQSNCTGTMFKSLKSHTIFIIISTKTGMIYMLMILLLFIVIIVL